MVRSLARIRKAVLCVRRAIPAMLCQSRVQDNLKIQRCIESGKSKKKSWNAE
jgi:hypothetical protein